MTQAPSTSTPTLQDLIHEAQTLLEMGGVSFGHGTLSAQDEAIWLVLWQLGLPLDTDLRIEGARIIDPESTQLVRNIIQKRIQTRKPAAYLTREAWLQGIPFYVDERVIVPRSLIAEIIAEAPQADSIDGWLGAHTHRVLDMCTGSGALAILAALAWPEVTVDACDLSVEALEVAALNVRRHNLEKRIRLLHSDGWINLKDKYDLILCNPPYVSQTSMERLPIEHRKEPLIALDGGPDGMFFIRHFLAHAAKHMNEDGIIVLEIGYERKNFEAVFPELAVEWLRTSAGDDSVALITQTSLLAAQDHLPPDPKIIEPGKA